MRRGAAAMDSAGSKLRSVTIRNKSGGVGLHVRPKAFFACHPGTPILRNFAPYTQVLLSLFSTSLFLLPFISISIEWRAGRVREESGKTRVRE